MNCDICSSPLASQQGTRLSQNRVATSPWYWNYVIDRPGFHEQALATTVAFVIADRSGFLVCSECHDSVRADFENSKRVGLTDNVDMRDSNQVDGQSVATVAGGVWAKLHDGQWPQSLFGGSDASKSSTDSSSGCFVATVVYGDKDAPEVRVLRAYRDTRLSRTLGGRSAIRAYSILGPIAASTARHAPWLRAVVKPILDRLARHLDERVVQR